MGMGDCLRCIKYLLFVFNLLFCLIGLAILAVGVWLFVKPATDWGLSDELHAVQNLGIFFIVVGSLITILGFLGCCGAIFENRCLLVLFFILLLLIFLVLLAVGILVLFMKATIAAGAETHFTTLVNDQNNTASKNLTDSFQSLWNCCGAKHAEKDYIDQNLPIPESCEPAIGKVYVSCSEKFGNNLSQWSVKIVVSVFITALVAFLGMIFSMMLCCAISDMA